MLHEPASYGMLSPGFQALEAACPSLWFAGAPQGSPIEQLLY